MSFFKRVKRIIDSFHIVHFILIASGETKGTF